MRKLISTLVFCAFVAACEKAAPPPPPPPVAPPAAVQPVAAPPQAPGPKDPEIAALYAKIKDCDAGDLSKCEAAKALEMLAKERNKDKAKQKPSFDAMIDCIELGNSAQRYACVYAVNFSLYPDGRRDDVDSAKRVLIAAKAETARYASSRIGEFLSGFYESKGAAEVHPQVLAFLKDQAAPEPARLELVRLSFESVKRPEHVETLFELVNDEKSSEALRCQIMNVLFRVEDPAAREKFETSLIPLLESTSVRVGTTAMEALGNIGGKAGFDAVLKTWAARQKDLKEFSWASSTARAMQNFLQRGDQAPIDRKKAYSTALSIGKDKKITAFFRGNAIYALENSGIPQAVKDLEGLAKDKDESFAKQAKEAAERAKKKAAEAKAK